MQASGYRAFFNIGQETGVIIPRVLMNFHAINSIPNMSQNQNVSVIYYAVLPGTIDDYELTSEHSEKDEVAEISFKCNRTTKSITYK